MRISDWSSDECSSDLVMICCKVTPACHMGIESTKALILLVKLSPYHEQALIAGRGRQCLMERGVRGEEFQRHLAVFSEARRGRPQLVLGSDQPTFPFDSAALNRAAAGDRLDVAAQEIGRAHV